MTQGDKRGRETMAVSFKGAHFPKDIILTGVRWYVAYPLSTRHVEKLMLERGVHVEHSTINRWVVKYSPLLEEAFHRRKRPYGVSWRMDETYIKIKGTWYYLYRAVDKTGQTIDFLLTAQRDEQAAKRFLTKAIRRHGVPEKITIDGSAANEAAIKSYNEEHGTAIIIRKIKYLNNIVEQDHRAVKRVTRPMLGFKAFEAAQDTLVGIELMHMIKKRQMRVEAGDEGRTVLLPRRLISPQTGATAPSRPPTQNLRHNPAIRHIHRLLDLGIIKCQRYWQAGGRWGINQYRFVIRWRKPVQMYNGDISSPTLPFPNQEEKTGTLQQLEKGKARILSWLTEGSELWKL